MMGNQNTSGIVEEEKPKNRAVEEEVETESREESQVEGTEQFQEKVGISDCHDQRGDQSLPVVNMMPVEKDALEEASGAVSDELDNPLDNLPNSRSKNVDAKASNLEEGEPSEMHDQSTETQSNSLDSKTRSTSSIEDSSNSGQESTGAVASEPEDYLTMLLEKSDETSHDLIDSQVTLNLCIDQPLDIDDHRVETGKDDSVVVDDAFNEGMSLETCDRAEEISVTSMFVNKESDDVPSISVPNLSPAEVLKEGDFSAKLVSDDQANVKSSRDQSEVEEVDSLSEAEKVDHGNETELEAKQDEIESIPYEELASNKTVEKWEQDDSADEKPLVDSPAKGDEQETVTTAMEKLESQTGSETDTAKCESQLLSVIEIKTISESDIPAALPGDQRPASEVTEPFSFEPNPRDIGIQVEIRKSPSFDFGVPFDARSEESDQTPLLYQDRTPTRSLSSSSAPRFQSRSVQTEYTDKVLQYESVEVEVEVEEKTIRMERNNSETLTETNARQEAPIDTDYDTADSPTSNNGKKKRKSSLFTTCMCCTQPIS